MMRIYCTLFAANYADKGLALYRSMQRHCGDFKLFILTMDEAAEKLLRDLNLQHAEIIPRREVDTPELLEACKDRTLGETCWTYSPIVVAETMRRVGPKSDRVVYLDADTFFFSSPAPAFEEIGNAPLCIVPHRFPPRLEKSHGVNGKFNLHFCGFTWDQDALLCLEAWQTMVTHWCYHRVEVVDGKRRMGDQAYWDDLALRYPVHAIRHIGVGTAPWNMEQYTFGPGPVVDGQPLINFHFHEFSWPQGQEEPLLTNYPVADDQREHVYEPYLQATQSARKEINDACL